MKPALHLQQMKDYIVRSYKYCDGKVFVLYHHHKSKVGKELKGTLSSDGYIQVCIKGKTIKMHRLIFFLCHGYLPDAVDHVNRIKTDNNIENLRASSNSMNIGNSNKQGTKRCTSMYKGVYFRNNTYEVSITKNGRAFYLGRFKNEEVAARAYDEKAKQLFGDFACTNFN